MQNIYKAVQPLQKSPVETGGLCQSAPIAYFKIEDVLQWPSVNPATGIISTAIQLKPGKSIFLCQAVDKGRQYDEEEKTDSAGSYMDITVAGSLAGHNTANILTLEAMRFSQWGLIVKDRAGFYRLVGNADAGAKFSYKYSSGDGSGSRKVQLQWNWSNALSAPIYLSQTFNITLGGVVITAGKLTLIQRFKVGAVGAPMVDGDHLLTNAGFANKNLLVLASGLALPCDDGSGDIVFTIERHYAKTYASDTVDFVGNVNQDEIIEIYAFEN